MAVTGPTNVATWGRGHRTYWGKPWSPPEFLRSGSEDSRPRLEEESQRARVSMS